MSEMLEPYERLIPITVLGKRLEVPENNVLLRQLSFVAPDISSGRYCWNGECRYCEVTYRRPGGPDQVTLACLVKGFEGMQVTKLALEVKYNMSETLRSAPPAPEAVAPKG